MGRPLLFVQETDANFACGVVDVWMVDASPAGDCRHCLRIRSIKSHFKLELAIGPIRFRKNSLVNLKTKSDIHVAAIDFSKRRVKQPQILGNTAKKSRVFSYFLRPLQFGQLLAVQSTNLYRLQDDMPIYFAFPDFKAEGWVAIIETMGMNNVWSRQRITPFRLQARKETPAATENFNLKQDLGQERAWAWYWLSRVQIFIVRWCQTIFVTDGRDGIEVHIFLF